MITWYRILCKSIIDNNRVDSVKVWDVERWREGKAARLNTDKWDELEWLAGLLFAIIELPRLVSVRPLGRRSLEYQVWLQVWADWPKMGLFKTGILIGDLWRSISLHFGSPSQNSRKSKCAQMELEKSQICQIWSQLWHF